jgi:hypothetical protein
MLLLFGTTLFSQTFTVSSSTPADGATNVSLQSSVSFTFSAPLDTIWKYGEGLLPIGLIAADPRDSILIDSVTVSSDLMTVSIHVQHTPNTDFSWILTAAKSTDSDYLSVPYALNYTTASAPGTQSVSGTVTFPSSIQPASNRVAVALLDRAVFSGDDNIVLRATISDENGAYSMSGVRNGVYWPTSAIDVDQNGEIEDFGLIDLFGFYDPNNDGIPDSIVVDGNSPTGVDIPYIEITLTTARGVKMRADNAAAMFAGDQQLKFVGTLIADTTGQSLFWIYAYYSPTIQKETYVFATTGFVFADTGSFDSGDDQGSRIMQMSKQLSNQEPMRFSPSMGYASAEQSDHDDDLQLASMRTIPSNFVDSDSAFTVAETNGGATFRGQYPGTFIFMFGGNFYWAYPADSAKIFWAVEYHALANDTTLVTFRALVDMSTAQLLTTGTTDVPDTWTGSAARFQLSQNYPNPFNPETVISFELPQKEFVSLIVYNILGQEVAQLANEEHLPGHYTVRWNGRDHSGTQVATGLYIYRIRAGAFYQTKKMVLIR